MDLNLTLLGEMITFAIFIWFTMKFVWPPLMANLEARRQKIADGLEAGLQGERNLEDANIKVREQLLEAKADAASILEQANQRAAHIVEEAKHRARAEGERLLALAKCDIDQQYQLVKQALLSEVSAVAIAGVERILEKEVDKDVNDRLIKVLAEEI